MRNGPLLGGCLLALVACQPPASPVPPAGSSAAPVASTVPAVEGPLAELTIPARPDWTDKYADVNEGDFRFFDIDGVMDRYRLSRAAAVELQNHFRDLSRADQGEPETWFEEALGRAQAGRYEDRRDLEALGKAAFIVVFDLDETLYDQYYPAEVAASCHDVVVPRADGKTGYLTLAPAWDAAIRGITALGGAVALYSANVDVSTWENGRAWRLDDQPIVEHPLVSGFLTNSHLVLQMKNRGEPVVEPSKDLRIFDEALRKVIIVDDNESRIFQPRNLRLTPKLDAEELCRGDAESLSGRRLRRTLPAVVREIEQAVAYQREHGGDFVDAFLPYSLAGQLAIEGLVATGASEAEATAWVREHAARVK